MKKIQLRNLGTLCAGADLLRMAQSDVLVKKAAGWNREEYLPRYEIYMDSRIYNDILKVAFYTARDMRLGANQPVYELFIDKKSEEFITWDVVHERWRNSKLDMLEWSRWFDAASYYVSPEGKQVIEIYLNVEDGNYKSLLEYQRKIRRSQLEKRRRKETDSWDLVLQQIPKLPKDWYRWVDKYGIHQNYIFYEYSRKGVKEGYCTWCEKMVPVRKPRNNAKGRCRCCGHEIQFKARGKAGSFCTENETAYLLQRCQDGFVIRQFKIRRHYHKNEYEYPERSCWEERRVIYNEALEGTAFYYGLYKNDYDRWITDRVFSYDFIYYGTNQDGSVYKRTIPSLASSELRKTGLPEYLKDSELANPERYIEKRKKHPYLEQLVKAGFTKLAKDIIYGSRSLELHEGNSLSKVLGIDKNQMQRLRERSGGWNYFVWLCYEREKGGYVKEAVIDFFMQHKIEPSDLSGLAGLVGEEKSVNYLKKQGLLSDRSPHELFSTWTDYLSMCKRLKRDVKKKIFSMPKNLIESHDEVVALCEAADLELQVEDILKEYPEVESVYRSIKEKYEFSDENYVIVVPERIKDIIEDGQALRHCTGDSDTYYARIQRRESYILFLRKAAQPEKAYYTLEIEPDGTARQKRTVGDKQNRDFDKAVSFIKKWQRVLQKRLTQEDFMLAKESARLRVKEFKELREKQTRIWRGHLAGKLLADVLEEDLLEVELCMAESENLNEQQAA